MIEAAESTSCPRCQGTAALMRPMTKKVDVRVAVYACKDCAFTFTSDGGAFVKDSGQLRDVFRAATLSKRALTETIGGESLNPATRALLLAQLIEYGTQMWFDGLKQGLLLGVAGNEKNDSQVPTGK